MEPHLAPRLVYIDHASGIGFAGGYVALGGAGGLGQLMDQSMKMLNGGEAATILATFLVLVLAADGLSEALRRRMA